MLSLATRGNEVTNSELAQTRKFSVELVLLKCVLSALGCATAVFVRNWVGPSIEY